MGDNSSSQRRAATKRPIGIKLILLLGIVAIIVGLYVRNSSWAQERRLKTLSLDELALAVHDSPNDSLTFTYYGNALLESGHPEASEQAFNRAVALNPKSARAYIGLGTALINERKFKSAVAAYTSASKITPKDTAIYLGMAKAYHSGGTSKLAIEPLRKVTELTPNDALAWYSLGIMYGNVLEWDSAYKALQKATSLTNVRSEYWRDLAQISMHYNHLEDAEKQYLKSLELSPKDPVANCFLGQAYMKMGDTPELREKAKKYLLAALANSPDMEKAFLELGRLHERMGDYSTAKAYLQKASDLDAGDDQALYHRGLCELKLGNQAEGKKLMVASQELGRVKTEINSLENRCAAQPTNRELRLRLARTYRRYGNLDGAMQMYHLSQEMGTPDSKIDTEIASLSAEIQRANAAQPASSTQHSPTGLN